MKIGYIVFQQDECKFVKKEASPVSVGRCTLQINRRALSCKILDLKKKKKSRPVTGLEWPRGFQEVKVPRFHDNSTGRW